MAALLQGHQERTRMPTISSSPSTHARRVVSFYETWWGSLGLRKRPASLAMHLGFWDGGTHNHAEAVANMDRELAKRAGLVPRDRLFDAGCGSTSKRLAREYGAEVVGLDLSPGKIHESRRSAHRQSLSHLLSFERQDFARTTFPDASFTVVWATESVCHAPEKQSFLAEARRLLKPGGRLVVADLFRTGGRSARTRKTLCAAGLRAGRYRTWPRSGSSRRTPWGRFRRGRRGRHYGQRLAFFAPLVPACVGRLPGVAPLAGDQARRRQIAGQRPFGAGAAPGFEARSVVLRNLHRERTGRTRGRERLL